MVNNFDLDVTSDVLTRWPRTPTYEIGGSAASANIHSRFSMSSPPPIGWTRRYARQFITLARRHCVEQNSHVELCSDRLNPSGIGSRPLFKHS